MVSLDYDARALAWPQNLSPSFSQMDFSRKCLGCSDLDSSSLLKLRFGGGRDGSPQGGDVK